MLTLNWFDLDKNTDTLQLAVYASTLPAGWLRSPKTGTLRVMMSGGDCTDWECVPVADPVEGSVACYVPLRTTLADWPRLHGYELHVIDA